MSKPCSLYPVGVGLALFVSCAAHAGSIDVDFSPLPSTQGKVYCAVHDNADGFPGGREHVAHVEGSIDGEQAHCHFDDVPPGTYAISVWHDENEDGEVNTNGLGMPTEKTGVSRDAPAHMGPPKYEDAVFDYDGEDLQLDIAARP